jgi:hypothetical protein
MRWIADVRKLGDCWRETRNGERDVCSFIAFTYCSTEMPPCGVGDDDGCGGSDGMPLTTAAATAAAAGVSVDGTPAADDCAYNGAGEVVRDAVRLRGAGEDPRIVAAARVLLADSTGDIAGATCCCEGRSRQMSSEIPDA